MSEHGNDDGGLKGFRRPPELEPLSDLSWRALENRVFSALEARPEVQLGAQGASVSARPTRRGLLVAGLGVGLAAAAAVALVVSMGEDKSEEPALEPAVHSRLVTAESSSSMTVGDASLRADPDTALLVSGSGARGIDVLLERGAVECTVGKRDGRPPFRVIAGDVTVTVIGTVFRVERVGDSARVTVEHGIVEVMTGGEVTRVSAGGQWPVVEAAATPADLGTTDGATDVATDGATDGEPADATKTPASPSTDTKTKTKTKTKIQAPAGPSAKALYAEAAALERKSPSEALAIYAQLARQRGPWASIALYAQARLELELGHRRRAQRSLARYLKKYPGGTNASDARTLLEKLEKDPR